MAWNNRNAHKTQHARLLSGVSSLALLVAQLVAAEQAHAVPECTPATSLATPANNTTITCAGGTITANGANGYGTGIETGDTINVNSSPQSLDPPPSLPELPPE